MLRGPRGVLWCIVFALVVLMVVDLALSFFSVLEMEEFREKPLRGVHELDLDRYDQRTINWVTSYNDSKVAPMMAQRHRSGELGREVVVPILMRTHTRQSNRIMINLPGFRGDIDGHNQKYVRLGAYVKNNWGAVIRMGNPYISGILIEDCMKGRLKKVIEYAVDESRLVCGSDDPEVYLMGFSAGASTIAAVAHEFPQVKRVLLMAPTPDMRENGIYAELGKFGGEVYVVEAGHDGVVPRGTGEVFAQQAVGASKVRHCVIDGCDHQFSGREGGLLVSSAPFWAFDDEINNGGEPDLDFGVEIYGEEDAG